MFTIAITDHIYKPSTTKMRTIYGTYTGVMILNSSMVHVNAFTCSRGYPTTMYRPRHQHVVLSSSEHTTCTSRTSTKLYYSDNNKNNSKRRITPADIEAIKHMADIIDVVESHNLPSFSRISPTRATAVCPFHDDTNPSLSISSEHRMYKCFSCGAGGDVFNFVREYRALQDGGASEKMSFIDAVDLVAKDYTDGSVIVSESSSLESNNRLSPKQKEQMEALQKKKERLKLANAAAADFYGSCLATLPAAGVARNHLRTRGVSPFIVRSFGLGYAPDCYFKRNERRGEGSLVERLRKMEFTANEIVEAGLATRQKSAKGSGIFKVDKSSDRATDSASSNSEEDYSILMDRFRGRLMVPIFDESGKWVTGFGGRIMEEETRQKSPSNFTSTYTPAKYVNSPESPVFSKKNTLFGSFLAKQSYTGSKDPDGPAIEANSQKQLVLVEGYFDVLSLHGVGIECATATMGTAITPEQLEIAAKTVGRGGMCA